MQTAYSMFPSAPRAGTLADLNEAITVTRVSAANIPFGRFGVLNADADANGQVATVKLPGVATDIVNSDQYNKCEGIVLATQSEQSEYGPAPVDPLHPEYIAGVPFPVIRHGLVWVYVEEAVGPADVPCVRFAAGSSSYAGTLPGNFNKGTDSANSQTLAGYARFMSTTTGAGLVQLMIRL